tara:strand:- start:3585 stop:4412 length:828 start_codon:yes stop_codon:yes gene_type:complete
MKVALNLSGLTRCLSYSWLFIDKYIRQPLNADVFLHTWDCDHGGSKVSETFNAPSIFPETTKQDYIAREIVPAQAVVESYNAFAEALHRTGSVPIHRQKEDAVLWRSSPENNSLPDLDFVLPTLSKWTVHSSFPMFYGIQQANLLRQKHERENDIQYDLVIRSRLDCFFEKEIPKAEIELALEYDTLFVAVNCSKENYIHANTTDAFAFSTPKTMDVYCDTFNLYQDSSNHGLLSESALQHQLNIHQIPAEWSDTRFKLPSTWTDKEVSVVGFHG